MNPRSVRILLVLGALALVGAALIGSQMSELDFGFEAFSQRIERDQVSECGGEVFF